MKELAHVCLHEGRIVLLFFFFHFIFLYFINFFSFLHFFVYTYFTSTVRFNAEKKTNENLLAHIVVGSIVEMEGVQSAFRFFFVAKVLFSFLFYFLFIKFFCFLFISRLWIRFPPRSNFVCFLSLVSQTNFLFFTKILFRNREF